ncbi:hypothetical protein JCM14076_12040 [Methylosoma difficile]
MPLILKAVVIVLVLASCGGKDSRYRDTELLERPPTLAIEKSIDEPAVEPDVSVIPKKSSKPGLRDAVAFVESEPMRITIRQDYETAWRSIGLALKQREIKITDHNRERGLYYVYYSSKGLFSVLLASKDEHHDANVMLTVEPEDGLVKVKAIPVTVSDRDEADGFATSDQESLLRDLYETLHDDLKEE